MAEKTEIADLVVVESQLNHIVRNEKVKDPRDREALRKYANKMVLVSAYMLEFNELDACIKTLSDIDCDNIRSISEKKFSSELKRDDAHLLYNGYFLKLAKLQNNSEYVLFTRSVPE